MPLSDIRFGYIRDDTITEDMLNTAVSFDSSQLMIRDKNGDWVPAIAPAPDFEKYKREMMERQYSDLIDRVKEERSKMRPPRAYKIKRRAKSDA